MSVFEDSEYKLDIGLFSIKATRKEFSRSISLDSVLKTALIEFDKTLEQNGIKAIRYFQVDDQHHPCVREFLKAICIARHIPDEREQFFNDFPPWEYAEECARIIKASGEGAQKYTK